MTEENSSENYEAVGQRVYRDRGFVQIENTMFADPRISGKAKALLAYLLSKPKNWKVRMSDLLKHFKEGEKAIWAGFRELKQFGYLRTHQTKKPDGTWGKSIWRYDDIPSFDPAEKVEIIKIPFDSSELAKNNKKTPQPQNRHMDETVDTTEFSPQPHFGHVDNGHTVNAHAVNLPHISNKDSNNTYSNKTTTNKTKKDLVSISSSSDEILKIDKTFQDLYKDAPLEEIKAKLFEDAESGKIKMKTEAQYMALVAKRIQFHLDALRNTPTTTKTGQIGEVTPKEGQIPIEEQSRQFKAILSRTSEVPNSEASSEPNPEGANVSKPNSETLETRSSETLETHLAVLTDPEKTPEEIAEAKKEVARLMDELRKSKKM